MCVFHKWHDKVFKRKKLQLFIRPANINDHFLKQQQFFQQDPSCPVWVSWVGPPACVDLWVDQPLSQTVARLEINRTARLDKDPPADPWSIGKLVSAGFPKAAAAGKNQDWGQNQGNFHAAGKDKNIHLHLSPQVTGNTRSLEVAAVFEIQRSRKA